MFWCSSRSSGKRFDAAYKEGNLNQSLTLFSLTRMLKTETVKYSNKLSAANLSKLLSIHLTHFPLNWMFICCSDVWIHEKITRNGVVFVKVLTPRFCIIRRKALKSEKNNMTNDFWHISFFNWIILQG